MKPISLAMEATGKTSTAPETTSIAFTEDERCLLLSSLARFADSQVKWAKVAKAKGNLKEARARIETGKRILVLSERIEKAAAHEVLEDIDPEFL